jgi:hypothetical protein
VLFDLGQALGIDAAVGNPVAVDVLDAAQLVRALDERETTVRLVCGSTAIIAVAMSG